MASLTSSEQGRLQALYKYGILDTPEDQQFDNLVKLAAQICEVPIAKINFIDEKRVWSKANFGNDIKESPREESFCNTTVQKDEYLMIEDASNDERFNHFEFVKEEPNIRFYAGVNIKKNERNLGTICVLGKEPKQLTKEQLDSLRILANEVEARLELHQKNKEQYITNAFLRASVDMMMIVNPHTLIVEEFQNNEPGLFDDLAAMDSHLPLDEYLPDWDFPNQLKKEYELNKESIKTESKLKLPSVEIYLEINASLNNDKWFITAKNITKRKLIEREVQKEKEFTEVIINSLPVTFFMYDEDFNLIRRHSANSSNYGYTDEEFMAIKPLDLFEGEDLKKIEDGVQQAFSQKDPIEGIEASLTTKSGKKEPFLFNAVSFINEGQKFLIGTSQSISAQRDYQKKLETILGDKEVLLAELHHRVKNNLAVIAGFLQMQEVITENKLVKGVLMSNHMRVKSMALVHEELYKVKNFSNIRFNEYLYTLLSYIEDKLGDDKKDIKLKAKLESFEMNLNQAVPLALIINELVTNAYVYAFEGRDKGEIEVKLSLKGEEIYMSVKDDGIGLPEGFVLEKSPTLGTTIVLTYSEQINSDIKINSEKGRGTVYELSFTESKNMKGSTASHNI